MDRDPMNTAWYEKSERPEPFVAGVEPILSESESSRVRKPFNNMDWRQLLGGLLVVAGIVVVIVGWYHASGTNNTTAQFSYTISAGFGGGAMVILGAVFFIAYEHYLDRRTMIELEERLGRLERGTAGEFDNMLDEIRTFLVADGVVLRSGEPIPETSPRRSR